MLIRDVMTGNPACCKPSDKLDSVAQLMFERDCGEIPVCDGTNLVGVITDRDITCRAVAAGLAPERVAVSEIMTRDVYSVLPDEKLDAALDLMEKRMVRRLPVVDKNGAIIGIVSQTDLVAKIPTLEVARAIKAMSKRSRKRMHAMGVW